MKKIDIRGLLLKNESEVLEFKEAKDKFDQDDIGEYFSALSNEAALRDIAFAYLIFGVSNDKKIVGTNYKKTGGLEKLKNNIKDGTKNLTFNQIYEEEYENKRIVIFEIPRAINQPTMYKARAYARRGDSLEALSFDKQKIISGYDWSAEICGEATIEDLDEEAIAKARIEYIKKNQNISGQEINSWSNLVFLKKAKIITPRGKITNAAIILLGKEESDYFIKPKIAKITWILKNHLNKELDGYHFGIPFILNADKVLLRIRNLRFQYLPDKTLFSEEFDSYDKKTIKEVLTNCIAHQDYSLQRKINVIEILSEDSSADRLIFQNAGSFIPETIENVIKQDCPQNFYRNRLLVESMTKFGMMDEHGSGIKTSFEKYKNVRRGFPLPDYEIKSDEVKEVKVVIYGKIIDENYVKILLKRFNEIDLFEAMGLDRVQKKQKIDKNLVEKLKVKKLIEGRYPNIFVAGDIVISETDKAKYIKNKAFEDQYLKDLIMKMFEKYSLATREAVNELLRNKLSDTLSEEQKMNKVKNLLKLLAKEGKIICTKIGSKSEWKINR